MPIVRNCRTRNLPLYVLILSLVELLEELQRSSQFLLDDRRMLCTAWLYCHLEGQWRLQDPWIISIRIQRYDLASDRINWLTKLKRPQEFSCNAPHVALSKVHARADTPPSAVSIVVAALPVGAAGVVVGKLLVVDVAVRIEAGFVFVDGIGVVDSPRRDEEGGAFRQQHAFILIVCGLVSTCLFCEVAFLALRLTFTQCVW